MSWELASYAILAAVLVGGFAWYERTRPPSQIVALVAALAALAIAGRVLLAPIPNVVATTDIVIFSGYALGGAPGFAVGALAGLISNFWLGQGPWTPWQMAGWGLCGVLGALLARASRRRAGRLELTLACGFAGIAYGALLNFSLMATYGGEFTLDRWLTLQARAVPFDLAHAIGNVTLALVAGPAMVRMLIRFRQRFEFRWSASDGSRAGKSGLATAATILLVSLALAAPAAAGSGLGWLQRSQNADGGFPSTPGQQSGPAITAWSMLGLEAAGVNPLDVERKGRSPVAFLRAHVSDLRSPGDLARTILALHGAGVDPRRFAGHDLVSMLSSRSRRDGSFQGWPNSTAFAVMALRSAGGGSGTRHSLAWLRRVQGEDGGWGAVPGAASDADSTGAVLQALGGGSAASRAGVRFLRRTQRANGGWPLGVSGTVNSQSTAWAIQGLVAAGVDPGAVRRKGRTGLDYLGSQRAGDGHYRYSSSSDQTPVWVTGQVLAAVNLQSFPIPPVARAIPAASGRGVPSGGAGEAHPLLSRRSREERSGEGPNRSARAAAKRSEGVAPPHSTPKVRSRNASATVPPGSATGGEDEDSPAGAILVGLGAAVLVMGGGWLASRRLLK